MARVKPVEWLIIFVFFSAAYAFLIPVGQSVGENSTIVVSEMLKTATLIAIALSVVEFALPYILLRLASSAGSNTKRLFQSPAKSLVFGLACSFVPTVYGFVVLTLGLSYSGFRLFGLAAVVAMAIWISFWLRCNRFETTKS